MSELPEGWAYSTISEFVSENGIFKDGDWVESKDQDPNGDVRLIQLADIGDGYFVDKSSRFLTSKKSKELNCTFLEKNDVLIARMPEPLGRACLFPFDEKNKFVTVVDVCAIRLDPKLILPKFLMHLINSPKSRLAIEKYKTGSTRKRISRGNLAKIYFPIPPYNEQKRIVAKIEELFSELDNGIESLKTAREKLSIYRQAILKHAFEGKLTQKWREDNGITEEWGKTFIKDIAEVGTGATPKRGKKSYYDGGTYPWVTSGALNSDYVRESSEFITDIALRETNCKIFPIGTILVAMYGEGKTRGKSAILEIEAATNQACAAINITSDKISRDFIWNFFKYNYENIRLLSSGGVQPNLNLSHIKNTQIPFPSFAEQEVINSEIDSKLTSLKKIEEEIECQLQKCEALRQSILKEAFSGKLVAQDPADEPASALLERIKAEKDSSAKPKKKRKAA